MRIGEFARLANVSVRTLRFYDETRLLAAVDVDVNSGYRCYDVAQLRWLREIQAFQELGFSLREIRELLRRELPQPELRQLIEQRRADLQRQIRCDQARLERIDQRLRQLTNGDRYDSEVRVHETDEAWIVSLRQKLRSYDQAEELFQELESRVPAEHMTRERAAFWHACGSDGASIDCEAVRYLRRPGAGVRGLQVRRLAGTTVASTFHFGDDGTMHESYKDLNRWLTASEFRLQGAKREIYWREPTGKKTDPAVTEIQFPVARACSKRSRVA